MASTNNSGEITASGASPLLLLSLLVLRSPRRANERAGDSPPLLAFVVGVLVVLLLLILLVAVVAVVRCVVDTVKSPFVRTDPGVFGVVGGTTVIHIFLFDTGKGSFSGRHFVVVVVVAVAISSHGASRRLTARRRVDLIIINIRGTIGIRLSLG